MSLQDVWKKYDHGIAFNYSDIAPYLIGKGQTIVYESGKTIVERGDFPSAVYFLIEGIAIGQRHYEDGNEYRYFQVDHQNGNLGLLEILGKKESYVATITTLTTVKVVKVESVLVYEMIMTHLELLRKCAFLLADDLYKRSGNDGIYYFYSGIDRVRLFIMTYYEQHQGKRVDELLIDMSYEEIANQIGVSLRTVGRSIKQLKETAEVTLRGKRISVSQKQYQAIKETLIH